MKHQSIAITTIIIFCLTVLIGLAGAKEPTRPTVDYTFDSKKEAKILELKGLQVPEIFNRLKGIDFIINGKLLNKAIFVAFNNSKKEAVAYAMRHLSGPRQIVEGERVSRNYDFDVAKKILRMFPDEAVDSLLEVYNSSDPVTKSNIICVLGKMAGGQAIRNLLIEALDDKTFCEEEHPEMIGEPLRICDEAYNQLVLRYSITNVLRTIGNVHRIEIRDYHIDELKGRL